MTRIVVAESNPDGGLLLEQALTALGHEVRLARDAFAAVSHAIALPAEVLVLSTSLPKGRSSEVVRLIRAAGVQPRRIIGLAQHGDSGRDLPEACAWLLWPLAPDDLQVVCDDQH
ncbi:MAG TPA: hypothetical protein VHX44_18900 [Planctomycetota bacterium]|nr:hypothetical protein [Planctomycetota bacterium]